jgi:hypothetical protein
MTNYAEDGKIMADDHHSFSFFVALRDALQARQGAVLNIDQSLASRHPKFRGLGAPPPDELGILLLDFFESEPFQVPVIQLADIVFDLHRQPVRLADELRRPSRPNQAA